MAKLPRVEQILERQAKSWEVRRRMAGEGGEAARRALAHLREGPWVSVSRQWGSQGLELAQRLGATLDWQVFDREVITAISEQTHTRETVLSRLDEQAIQPFKNYVSHLIVPDDTSQVSYVKRMTEIIWGLAKQGNAVIVGRGANWFLDARYGLRVRTVAPLDVRVARFSEDRGVGPAEARNQLVEHDAQRKGFIQQFFGRDIDDPLGYDLVLNLGTLDLDAAAGIVQEALRRKLHATA